VEITQTKQDNFCTLTGYIGSITHFLLYCAKFMLTNYHHKILNEPDRNYSFYRDKIGISLAIFFFVVALFFSVFPFTSEDRNIYGQSLGEGGFCFT